MFSNFLEIKQLFQIMKMCPCWSEVPRDVTSHRNICLLNITQYKIQPFSAAQCALQGKLVQQTSPRSKDDEFLYFPNDVNLNIKWRNTKNSLLNKDISMI